MLTILITQQELNTETNKLETVVWGQYDNHRGMNEVNATLKDIDMIIPMFADIQIVNSYDEETDEHLDPLLSTSEFCYDDEYPY
jgi:hypothetical protein